MYFASRGLKITKIAFLKHCKIRGFVVEKQRFPSIWLRFEGRKCSQTEEFRYLLVQNHVNYVVFDLFLSIFAFFLGLPPYLAILFNSSVDLKKRTQIPEIFR